MNDIYFYILNMRKMNLSSGLSKMLLLYILTVMPVTWCLEVLSIEGPSVIVNGSVPLVVLDCNYDLPSDKKGFVLKWFYNRQPIPVYQWIPPNEPQDLRNLKGRLDKQYAVSDDEYTKHRALAIRNPTTDLTGEYTCWISTFESEDFKRKSIIVYSPVTDMSLTWSRLSSGIIMITCNAGGIYPEPEVSIIRIGGATNPESDDIPSERLVLEGVNVQTVKFAARGFYNVSAQLQIFDHDLSEETMFECIITINGTEYQVREQMLYYPAGPPTSTTKTPSTSTTDPVMTNEALIKAESVNGVQEGSVADSPRVAESVSSGERLLTYVPLLIAALGFHRLF